MNDVTYLEQKVPSLYTALSVGKDASNPAVYGVNSNSFVVKYNEIVDIVLNNLHGFPHPFHLHGHHVQVVARSPPNAGKYNSATANIPEIPMRRDVVSVTPGGHLVVRFKADNPDKYPISRARATSQANAPCTRLSLPLPS